MGILGIIVIQYQFIFQNSHGQISIKMLSPDIIFKGLVLDELELIFNWAVLFWVICWIWFVNSDVIWWDKNFGRLVYKGCTAICGDVGLIDRSMDLMTDCSFKCLGFYMAYIGRVVQSISSSLFSYGLTAAILVYRKSPVGIEFSSHIKTFFCAKKIGIFAGQVSKNAALFQTWEISKKDFLKTTLRSLRTPPPPWVWYSPELNV